jgi:transposase
LTRYRVQQVRDRSQEVNRLCKVLEDAGLKLTTVITNVMGKSGRAMLQALVDGTTDPAVLAELARGKLRKKLPELRRALQGRFRSHHAFLIEQIFAKIDFLDEALERLTTEIDQRLVPFEPMLTALDTIPGVDRIGAISIVAETGGDMTRFLTAGHLCSWGAMCPGQNESAGKRRSGKTRKGNRYLRGTLIQAGLGGHAQERLGLASQISPGRAAPGAQEGGRGRWASDPRDCLLHHARRRDLRGAWGRLLQSAPCRESCPSARQAT